MLNYEYIKTLYSVDSSEEFAIDKATIAIDNFSYDNHILTDTETMYFADGYTAKSSVNYAEKYACAVNDYRGSSLPLSEQFNASTSITKSGEKRWHETIFMDDYVSNNSSLSKLETLNPTDAIYKTSERSYAEQFKASSSASRGVKESFYETTTIDERISSHGSLSKSEAFSTADAIYKTFGGNYAEQFSQSDFVQKNGAIAIFDTLKNGILMRPQNLFDRLVEETAETLETPLKSIYEHSSENVGLSEAKTAKNDVIYYESGKIGSKEADEWTIDRDFLCECKLADTENGRVTICKEEEVDMELWRIVPTACGVLSDIYLDDTAITAAEFEKISNKPSGYTAFSEFKVGEYEYKDALYRLDIQKSNLVSNPLVYDYKVHVDIDDVKDRGTATIPAEETKVYFNRSYYTEPDVVVNVISGTSENIVIPFITSTDGKDDKRRYFTVILKTRDGTPVKGKISWNSNGY